MLCICMDALLQLISINVICEISEYISLTFNMLGGLSMITKYIINRFEDLVGHSTGRKGAS